MRLRFIFCIFLYCFFLGSAAAQDSLPPERTLLIEVEDLRLNPDGGLLIDSFYLFGHDGNFDLFDYGQPAPEGLNWFANEGYVDELRNQLVAESPNAWSFMQVNAQLPTWNATNSTSTLSTADFVLPGETNYLSILSRIYPSDDAFYGNDDPKRYRIFDEEGNFLGPLVIDIHGSDILDAGTQINNEQDLLGLDRDIFSERGLEPSIRTEAEGVRPHPGFKGSTRNPDGQPVRILTPGNEYCVDGAPSCYQYDSENLDFTQAGYPIARIRLSLGDPHGGYSGTYFSPERDGEGFTLHSIGTSPRQFLIFWFTYAADDSGSQRWLIGQGLQPTNEDPLTRIQFWSTQGGQITSPMNPDSVELVPWGSAQLSSTIGPACRVLRLFDITTEDPILQLDLPDTPNVFYSMQRLGPDLTGVEQTCGEDSFVNLLPLP